MQAIKNDTDKNELETSVWNILKEINDPEIPVLSILDLGIVRAVNTNNDQVEIIITPTYSGCPAMDMIKTQIRLSLMEKGIINHKISTQLSPAWTTDWMTIEGKNKLLSYGIAPPSMLNSLNGLPEEVLCPQCHSSNTKILSEFGSTACKSLYQCNDCFEPFDHFKCH